MNNDRTVALLRKETAPLLIQFLYDSFRQANRVSYKHSELPSSATSPVRASTWPKPRYWVNIGPLRQISCRISFGDNRLSE